MLDLLQIVWIHIKCSIHVNINLPKRLKFRNQVKRVKSPKVKKTFLRNTTTWYYVFTVLENCIPQIMAIGGFHSKPRIHAEVGAQKTVHVH